MVEIVFILKGAHETPDGEISPFQHIPPFLLVVGG
jgi:hypothetical protein